MPLNKGILGCFDNRNSLDHFDPTAPSKRMFAHFLYLRSVYAVLQDGFDLVQRGNWTYQIQRPGSNNTVTEMGLWSATRAGITGIQKLVGPQTTQVWLLYTNENTTKSYTFNCAEEGWISSPYQAGQSLRNLFAPYETYQLQASQSSYFNNSQPPWQGCLTSVTMEAWGFKALVPESDWVAPPTVVTKFIPGHDARILVQQGDPNATSIDVSFEFNVAMKCDSVTRSLSFNLSSSGQGGAPTVRNGSINCGTVANPDPSPIAGGAISAWSWSATIDDVADGVLSLSLYNPTSEDGTSSTNVRVY
jgi:alpha-1,3-glucan synthase